MIRSNAAARYGALRLDRLNYSDDSDALIRSDAGVGRLAGSDDHLSCWWSNNSGELPEALDAGGGAMDRIQ